MSKKIFGVLALCAFSIAGLFMARLGALDILESMSNAKACQATITIQTATFWMLAAIAMPLFILLAFLPEKTHFTLLTIIVVTGLAIPWGTYQLYRSNVDNQGFEFKPEVNLYSFKEYKAARGPSCIPVK